MKIVAVLYPGGAARTLLYLFGGARGILNALTDQPRPRDTSSCSGPTARSS